ncbi:BCL5p [Penicillium frequentans]|uniref:BCL5p n=1 Tax=Penicillium frequentans TaxID=3151616 RepID=A0AAD6CQZ0_9EURO|nr:BCL5p [Penicillium glabrum]
MENGIGGNSKLLPLEPIDQWQPSDIIRTIVFLIVREVLNEDAMRSALNRLIRDHLPIIGARIEIISKELRKPGVSASKFLSADQKLFQWSNQVIGSSLAAAQVLPETSQADSDIFHGPCSIPELEQKLTPSTWPRKSHFENPDLPLLLVHRTKYTDATVVSMNLPHAVSDQMGLASLITAWTQLKGETPAEFLKLEPGEIDGPYNISKEELRRKRTFRTMTKSERIRAVMNLFPDLILNPKEVRQTLFLPIKLVEEPRDRHTQDLEKEYGQGGSIDER